MRLVVDNDWPNLAAERLDDRQRLCLPTGRTPIPFYDRLAPHALSESTVFLLDEFGLPFGHPARCDSLLHAALLDRVPPKRFERPMSEAENLDLECRRYHDLVTSAGGLDLSVLGLGLNGHLGLNEPGSLQDSTTRRVELTQETIDGARSYGADPPPTWGIALGLSEILASTEIWLLVSGRHKAEVLAATLTDRPTASLPASFLQNHPSATVYADRAAATLL
jgi:glucosamine-6-phosphate deaminase